jgi:two-component system response regulator AtoC
MSQVNQQIPDAIIFGRSEAMAQLRHQVLQAAAADVPVLLLGESGTGKGVIAGLIHQTSPYRSGPFVTVNCPAVPAGLIESELFGYERGAFTGAYERKIGLVESAKGGTLFLDEIGELAPSLQAKLLHLLQDGTFTRIGGVEKKQAEMRVVCATNRRLTKEIESGGFRADLFYRLNVISLEIPPLRERRQDIRLLAEYFLDRYHKEYGSQVTSVSSRIMKLLDHYNWPGNVRELENLIRRWVVLGSEEAIVTELLGEGGVRMDGSKSLKNLTREAIRDFERTIILDVLYANNWNRKETARILKISYRALYYKLKDSGVPRKRTVVSESLKAQQDAISGSRKAIATP